MIRKIIKIDTELCNGCGACASACHEGAIGMVNGKAVLLRENYCDGLGDCLPACPTGAISFEEREAPAYDEAAVKAAQAQKQAAHPHHGGGCPGSRMRSFGGASPCQTGSVASQLRQWPVQIKLVPLAAPFFDGADVLIAADCTAFACGSFHQDYMQGKVTLIGCPKLDDGDYTEKLAEIFARNNIRSVTVTRMEVPCCGGLEMAVRRAIAISGKELPLDVATLSIQSGERLS